MNRDFFFAGGGTGGHIYPAIAVAERITRLEPTARVQFLCSGRSIDRRILDGAGLPWIPLPAQGFSARPGQVLGFVSSFRQSYRIARSRIASGSNPSVVAMGGFAAAPVALAARRLRVPMALINVDLVPGKANRLIARWANAIFLQFEETRRAFARHPERVRVVGCPLRTDFDMPRPERARRELELDPSKKVLLITG
nr:glycosyltransferase [Phycisphaerae bacterium]